MQNSIKILIADDNPEFQQQVQALSNRIEIIGNQQLKEQPDLISQLEIVYGGLRPQQIPQAINLRWLQTTSAGVERLITPGVLASDLIVTNARGIHAEPITEHMFSMVLMFMRRLAPAWDQQKTRQWHGYDFGANVDLLAGKTLGVLGVGAIGGHSARVGKAFGMSIIGLRRSNDSHPFVDVMYSFEERFDFLRESDVVMNSLPLTKKTHHFLSDEEFAVMKPGAIIVNAGRGATIDTDALVKALRAGRPKAALLDVTDPEPLSEDHPLWTMENVFITPHYGGAHPSYNRRAGAIFLENLKRYMADEPLLNVVDKEEGY